MTTQARYVRIPDRYTIPADLEHKGYVSTFELCITLGMGMEGLRYWRRDRNWPTDAVTVRPPVTLTPDGTGYALAGSSIFYPHTLRNSTDCTTSSSESGVSVSVNRTMASMLRSAAEGRK